MGAIHTKLVGVTFSNPDGSSRQDILGAMSEADDVFAHESDNDRYPDAITIRNEADEILGHLPKELAKEFGELGIAPSDISVKITSIYGGYGDKSYGCTVRLLHPLIKERDEYHHEPEVFAKSKNTSSGKAETFETYNLYKSDISSKKEDVGATIAVVIVAGIIIAVVGYVAWKMYEGMRWLLGW